MPPAARIGLAICLLAALAGVAKAVWEMVVYLGG